MSRKKTRNSGFTLVELGVVLAVLSIMAMLTIPNFDSWRTNMLMKSASRDLYSTLQEARLLAIKNNDDTAVVFDTANNRYHLCDGQGADGSWTGANDALGTGDNSIVRTGDLTSDNLTVQYGSGIVPAGNSVSGGALPGDGITYASNCVTMNSRGTGKAGYVYIEDGDSTLAYAVGTQSSGLIRLLKWDGGTWQ